MILNDTVTLKRNCRNDLRFRRSSPIFDVQKIRDERKNKKKSTDFFLSLSDIAICDRAAQLRPSQNSFVRKLGRSDSSNAPVPELFFVLIKLDV